MKNFIEYFYNIKIDKIFYEKNYYFFAYNGYTYKLYALTREYDVNLLLYMNQKMLNNTLVSEIIINRNNEIISIYNENKFILIKIFVNVNKNISLNVLSNSVIFFSSPYFFPCFSSHFLKSLTSSSSKMIFAPFSN